MFAGACSRAASRSRIERRGRPGSLPARRAALQREARSLELSGGRLLEASTAPAAFPAELAQRPLERQHARVRRRRAGRPPTGAFGLAARSFARIAATAPLPQPERLARRDPAHRLEARPRLARRPLSSSAARPGSFPPPGARCPPARTRSEEKRNEQRIVSQRNARAAGMPPG